MVHSYLVANMVLRTGVVSVEICTSVKREAVVILSVIVRNKV